MSSSRTRAIKERRLCFKCSLCSPFYGHNHVEKRMIRWVAPIEVHNSLLVGLNPLLIIHHHGFVIGQFAEIYFRNRVSFKQDDLDADAVINPILWKFKSQIGWLKRQIHPQTGQFAHPVQSQSRARRSGYSTRSVFGMRMQTAIMRPSCGRVMQGHAHHFCQPWQEWLGTGSLFYVMIERVIMQCIQVLWIDGHYKAQSQWTHHWCVRLDAQQKQEIQPQKSRSGFCTPCMDWWCTIQSSPLKTKLITSARIFGRDEMRVVENRPYDSSGKRISRTKNVITISNTPSLKASTRNFFIQRNISKLSNLQVCCGSNKNEQILL